MPVLFATISRLSLKTIQLSVKNSPILSPLKRIEMFSGVLKNIQSCDSNCGCLEASLAVIIPPPAPDVITSLLEYIDNMICHICYTSQPWIHLWFAET